MLGYDDKRAFFRMMMNSPCEINLRDDESSRGLSAVCRDISATGMSFELDEPIEMGAEVEVAIESTNSQIASLSALAKVVRSYQLEDGNYVVGVEILQMM